MGWHKAIINLLYSNIEGDIMQTASGFTDLHTHILPGVDDGAAELSAALAMLALARQDGTRRVILTPHYRRGCCPSPKTLHDRFSALQCAAAERFPELELYLGCEIAFFHEAPELLTNGGLLTMGPGRYVLVEFSPDCYRSHLLHGLNRLLDAGYYPILAHAERYGIMTPELAWELTSQGVLLQLNADSVLGKSGFRVKRLCRRLLQAKLVFCIASDAHDCTRRPPLLRECRDKVSKKYGQAYADLLFDTNPRSVTESLL